MDLVLALLAANARELLIASSAVLGTGVLAVMCSGVPIHRQRIAELAVIAGLAWFVLAFVPLPRWSAAVPPGAPAVAVAVMPAPATPLSAQPLPVAEDTPALLAGGPPALPATPPAPPLDWVELAAGGYACGAVVSVAYLLLGMVLLRRLLGRTRPAPEWLQQQLRELAARQAMPVPALRVSPAARRPFCCGWGRTVVVLPAGLCQPRHREMLRAVLLHELGHVHQRDGRGRALFALALPLFYAHPFYWWLRAQAYFAAELVADDWAARGSDRRGYANSLIRLSEGTTAAGQICVGAMPVLHSPSEFYRRMKMLIQSDRHVATQCSPRRRGTHLLCAGLLVAASAAVWGVELPAQGAARSTSPQQERADLRREVTELRSELRSLKSVLRRFARTRAPVADEARNPLASATPPEPAIPGSAGTRQPAPPNPLVAAEPIAVAPSIGLPASPAVDVLPDPGMAPRASGASGQSLMALATQRIELSGEIDVAAARLNLIERRAAEGAVDKTEVEVAQIEMNTLQRKSHLLDQMIDAELDACRFEMARLDKRMAVTEQLAKNGYVSADEPAEIEANYRRLRATYKLLKATR